MRRIERSVVSRAMGRELTEREIGTLGVNRVALGQQVSEVLGAKAHAEAYAALYATYDRQQRVRRWISIVSPAIALLHWSSSLSGTDVSAHRHFALEAERQRQLIIRKMNEDMMVNGASQGYEYLASASFWRTIPDFAYEPPSIGAVVGAARPDGLALLAWSALALSAAWLSAWRQRPI